MSVLDSHRMDPSQLAPDVLRRLDKLVQGRRVAALVESDGTRIEMPAALYDLIAFVVEAMGRRQAVLVTPEDAALSPQVAARYLGMSRPYLVRLLDAGELPFHRVGTHRRVMVRDLRAFHLKRDQERRRRLDALAGAVDEAGLYDRF